MIPISTIKKHRSRALNGVSRLVEDKYFFHEYQKYIKASIIIDPQNEFLYFIGLNYIEAAALGVFRQVDRNRKSQSLLNVLREIDRSASLFTFARFSRKYKGLMRQQAVVDFAQFAVKDGSRIDRMKLKRDIAALKRITKPIVKYRHKVVAHQNHRRIPTAGKINDLYTAIELLEHLVIKYNLLLTQGGMTTLLPGNTRPNLGGIFK